MRVSCRVSRHTLAAGLFLSACHPNEGRTGPPAGAVQKGTGSLSPGEPERYAGWDAVRTWPTAAEPFVSHGHAAGRYTAEVRVSPDALETYRELVAGTELPVGAGIAMIHRERGTGAPGPVFLMSKIGPEQWELAQTNADGIIVPDTRTDLCARCHADGVSDFLFGIPGRNSGGDESVAGIPGKPDAGRGAGP